MVSRHRYRRTPVANMAELPASATATTHRGPDAELIQVADAAVALFERAGGCDLADEERDVMLSSVDAMIGAIIILPAATSQGLAAKARLLRTEYPAEGPQAERYDPAERLVQSLLSDLIRQGGRA